MSAHRNPRPGQLDRLLLALRATGPDAYRCNPERPDRWHAYCPGCGSTSRRLTIIEHRDGSVGLHCATGCTVESIIVGLRLAERLYELGIAPGWLGEQPSTDAGLAAVDMDRSARGRRLVAALAREAT